MKFWPRNVFDKMQYENDIKFLQSMMTDRIACIGGLYLKNAKKVKKAKQREELMLKRKEKEARRKSMEQPCSSSTLPITDSDTTEDEETEDQSFEPSSESPPKRWKKNGLNLYIQPDILKSPTLVQTVVRNKVTHTALTVIMHDVVTEAKGDPTKLNLGVTTAYRYKVETVCTISEKIHQDWIAAKSFFDSLGWETSGNS